MMNPKNIKPAVPKYRFKGAYDKDGNWIAFTDPWEQRKLGEITELKSASRVHKNEWTSNGVPFYRSSDVMAAINGTENEKAFISEELYEKLSKVSGKLEEGDILVTGGGSVGNPYIVPDNKPLYTKDADLLWIKNKGKFHPYFLYEFFFSPTFRNYLGSISHVGTIAHYTITQLSETPICLPSFEEQKEVGEYFQSLDNLITLVERKCENYRKAKQAMMQKLFSQEVRFTADDGSEFPEWEEKAIYEITTWDKKFNEVEKYKQQSIIKYPYVLADTLKNMKDDKGSVKLLSTGTYMDYTTEEKAGKNLCEGEIIAIPWGGEPNIKYHKGKFVTSDNRIAQATNPQTTNLKWLAYYMSSKMTEIRSYYRGASIKHPSMKAILDMHITIPYSIEEQTKIADCLSKYDDLITATENKLTAYRQLKKCMLQNMFV